MIISTRSKSEIALRTALEHLESTLVRHIESQDKTNAEIIERLDRLENRVITIDQHVSADAWERFQASIE
jgi:hypothetical protein